MTVILCEYDIPHEHEFPEDWVFGGADGMHFGADVRWKPVSYTYYNEAFEAIHVTSAPLCDQQAIDEFTLVANYGAGFVPVYLGARHQGEAVATMLPVKYNKADDTVEEIVRAKA